MSALCEPVDAVDRHRQTLARIARGWLARRPVYLDTETTGLGPDAEIVEIAILETDGSALVDLRVRPKRPIPPAATRVHGIGNWDVRDAPSWPEVQEQVAAALRGRALVIYNAAYDLRMLVQTAWLHDSPRPPAETAFCAMKLYAEWYGEWNDIRGSYRWQRLGEAARQMGLAVPADLHSAAADAGLTRRVVEGVAGG
ncbi:MAG: 3'-5' exonuclease [Thiohalocapsa sp.]|nr:3'-5' exonuclease [Thiohalocapsa sp.]